jgi:predicted O-linked N-acetylglucosamine transferase (SPINDLY family)
MMENPRTTSELIDISAVGGPSLELAAERREWVRRWLRVPAEKAAEYFAAEWGKSHKKIYASGVRQQMPLAEDESLRREVLEQLAADSPSAGALMAGMLMFYAHQWPRFIGVEQVPQWMIDPYITFLMDMPTVLWSEGEADANVEFMEKLYGHVNQRVAENPTSPLWQQISRYVIRSGRLVPAYFTWKNLRPLMSLRASVMEQGLGMNGIPLDHTFAARSPRPKIRLGVLAMSFCPATETFATLPIYRHLDRQQFDVILLSMKGIGHRLEAFCARHADAFAILPTELPMQVRMIREMDLDILLITTNVTFASNDVTLLAPHRLARVQVATVNSSVTTGMRNVDWHLSGTLVEPGGKAQEQYTERLLEIEGTGHCFDYAEQSPGPDAAPMTRQEAGVEAGAIIFTSGASGYKIIPELENTWAKILAATPGSRLMLHPENRNWSQDFPRDAFASRLKNALQSQGVSPQRLLLFGQPPTRQEFLRLLQTADIYLDSFPFSGATTMIDGLLSGLPPVTLEGCHFRSMMGAGIAREIGLPELVAANLQEYADIAVKLAGDENYRTRIRKKIADVIAAGPRFMDGKDYARQIGHALQHVWKAHQSNAKS